MPIRLMMNPPRNRTRRRSGILAAGALALAALGTPVSASFAQSASDPSTASRATMAQAEFPQLTLSADAWREVVQDRVAVTLYASHDADQPAQAQARVNERLGPVLERLRKQADLEVESAGYRTDPVWKDSKITGWRARGAIRITAAPSETFNALIGELSTSLNVESIAHFLSREARTSVERALIDDAVGAFRAKADAAAAALGFSGWRLHAVSLGDSGGGHPEPMPRMMMARAAADSAAPAPIAEGRTTVSVTVSGSVVLTD